MESKSLKKKIKSGEKCWAYKYNLVQRRELGVQKRWESSKNSGCKNISGPVHGWI